MIEAFRCEDLFFEIFLKYGENTMAFRTQTFFLEIILNFVENNGISHRRTFFFEVAPSEETLPPQIFVRPPKNSVLATCLTFAVASLLVKQMNYNDLILKIDVLEDKFYSFFAILPQFKLP